MVLKNSLMVILRMFLIDDTKTVLKRFLNDGTKNVLQ